jgi:hypothetical protein
LDFSATDASRWFGQKTEVLRWRDILFQPAAGPAAIGSRYDSKNRPDPPAAHGTAGIAGGARFVESDVAGQWRNSRQRLKAGHFEL